MKMGKNKLAPKLGVGFVLFVMAMSVFSGAVSATDRDTKSIDSGINVTPVVQNERFAHSERSVADTIKKPKKERDKISVLSFSRKTLSNGIIRMTLDNYGYSNTFYYPDDGQSSHEHMYDYKTYIRYNDSTQSFTSFSVKKPITLTRRYGYNYTNSIISDGNLDINITAILFDNKHYILFKYDLLNVTTYLRNVSIYQGADLDMEGSGGGEVGYYDSVNDIVFENQTRNIGFGSDNLSDAHDLSYYSSMWSHISSDTLNNDTIYPTSGTADVGIALKWNLGDLSVGTGKTMHIALAAADSYVVMAQNLQEALKKEFVSIGVSKGLYESEYTPGDYSGTVYDLTTLPEKQIKVVIKISNPTPDMFNVSLSDSFPDEFVFAEESNTTPNFILTENKVRWNFTLEGNSNYAFIYYLTIGQPGDYWLGTAKLVERNEEFSFSSDNVQVHIIKLTKPDLAVNKITWPPSSICDGDQVAVNATIVNNGTDKATDFFVRFEIDGDYIGRKLIADLPAGANTTITQNWLAGAGSHNVTVYVDEYDAIEESDDTNNKMYKDLPFIQFPDLTVTNISWTPTDIVGGDTVTFTATVTNIGAGSTSNDFYVRFEVDGKSIGHVKVSDSLDSGSSTEVTQSWTATWASTINVSVDEEDAVVESDETNNRMSKALPGLPFPDLIVTSLTWDPKDNVSAGDPVTFTATIENIGGRFHSTMSKPLKIAFLINDEYVGSRNIVGGIRTGQPLNTTFTWSAQPGTNPEVCVVADYSKIIPESDEDNNELCETITLTIKSPDLTITQLTFEPTGSILVGDTVQFRAEVANIGAGDYNGDFDIGFYVDDVYVGATHVANGVPAGESIFSTFNWTASSCSDPVIKAKADFFDTVRESDEANNEKTEILPASVPYADLAITDINWSPGEDIKDRDPVTFNVTVKNRGPGTVVTNFNVYFDIDGYFTRTNVISGGLAAGESKTTSFTWKATPGDGHNATAKADPDNVVQESDKTNNEGVQLLPFNVSLVEIFEVRVEPVEITTGIGGQTSCRIEITNYGSASGNFDINVSGLDYDWYTLSKTSVYLSAGQEEVIDMIISVPETCVNSETFSFQVAVTSQETGISRQDSVNLIVEPTPVIHNLQPKDGASSGSDDVTFYWDTYINATTRIYLKSEDETDYNSYTGAEGQIHTVIVSNLVRDKNYSYYAESTSTCGTNTSSVRTLYIGNGICFTKDVYEFTVERDYNQRVTIGVWNTDNEYHELLVEVPTTYDDLVLGFVGAGSQDNKIPLNPGESKDITLAVHLQDAMNEEYEFMANLKSTKGDETLTDTARIKIHVHVPRIDYDIEEIGINEITLMKTFRLTNRGDPVTDLTISVADNLKENAYIEPVIEHYRLDEGASIEFNVVPILSSPDFQPASPIPPVEGDISVNAAGIEAKKQVCFTVPEGKQPYKATVSSPGVIYLGYVKSYHCNNNPSIKFPFDIPPKIKDKVRDDPLVIKFSAPGWEVKPHDIYISINGHEVGSLINTIPEGYYKFDVDPSFLIYPERGVAKNYIELHTVHQNGGHYLVSSDVEVRLNLENYETWVIASSQEEANQIAADNLPPGFYESPDSIIIGEVEIASEAGGSAVLGALGTSSATREVYLGVKTTIRVTAESGLDVWAEFSTGDKAVYLHEAGSTGSYEGGWTPVNPSGNCIITIRAKGSGVKGKIIQTVKIINPTELEVEIIEPKKSLTNILTVDDCYTVKAKVTRVDDTGKKYGPALSASVHADFTSGDAPMRLSHAGGGIYSADWTPQNPADACTITVGATQGNLKPGSDSVTVEVKPKLELKIKIQDIPQTTLVLDPYWDYSWLSRRPGYYEKRYGPNNHFDPNKQCLIPIKVTPNRDAVVWVKITDPCGREVFDEEKILKKNQPWSYDLDVKDFDAGNCKIEVKGKAYPLHIEEWDVEEFRKIKIERNPYYITIKEALERDATESDAISKVEPWGSVMVNKEAESRLSWIRGLKGAGGSVAIGEVSLFVGWLVPPVGLAATVVAVGGFAIGSIWSCWSAGWGADVGEGHGDLNYFYYWYEQEWKWRNGKYERDTNWPVVGKKSILFPRQSGLSKEKERWGTVSFLPGWRAERLKNNFYGADTAPGYYEEEFGPPWVSVRTGRNKPTKLLQFIEKPSRTVHWEALAIMLKRAIQLHDKSQDEGGLKSLASLEDVSLVALADKMTYRPGETIQITAIVLEGDTPPEGTSVSAQIQRPDGEIDNLPLFDDGLHNDFEANDGFYCNSYTGDGVGVYKVTVSASRTSLRGVLFDLSTVLPVIRTVVTAEFNDICSDRGIDANSDGLFDYLVVDVGVNVTGAGDYGLLAELTDAQAACIARAQNYSRLDVGEQTVELSFDGVRICRSSADGPYNLLLTLCDPSTGYVLDYVYDEAYTTPAYSSSDFQAPPGELTAILSDRGTDTDGDGLYNYLTVDVGVNVTTPGDYTIEGFLCDTDGDLIAWVDNQVSLNSGEQINQLDFDGQTICEHGVNGPYNLTGVILYDEAGNPIDYQAVPYTTSAYSYTDFQPLPARFNDNYSDQGKDTDSDGKYNYLTVKAGVTVATTGNYTIEGQLYDADGDYIAWTNNKLHLDSGDHLVELNFDCMTISRHSVDGAYNLTDLYLSNMDTNEVVDVAFDAYTTTAYSYDDFETPSVQFNDNFSDYGTDTDGDGLYDHLTVEVGVNVIDTENYSLEGRLEDSDGNYMAYACDSTDLDAGSQAIQLNFDGSGIRKHGVNGQYSLKSIRLYGENGMTILDSRSDAYTTSAYNYTQFESYPVDLSLLSSDITFDPETPTAGETVIITATIRNTGTDDVSSVVVQFFVGDPDAGGVQIGSDRTISSIPAGGTGTAQMTWTAIPGTHDIFVRVDPYNSISEASENNNQAHKPITIEQTYNQLPIASFTYSPLNPVANETILFNASNSYDPDGYIVNYEWGFGDEIAATGEIVEHSYSKPGDYTVILRVTDNDSVSNTNTMILTITMVETAVCGEVTGDINVTLADARRIVMWLSYPEDYPIHNLWAADVTGDGTVTMADARRIVMWLSYPYQYPLTCSLP